MGDLIIQTMIEEIKELRRIRDDQLNEIFHLEEDIKKYKEMYENLNTLHAKYEDMIRLQNER